VRPCKPTLDSRRRSSRLCQCHGRHSREIYHLSQCANVVCYIVSKNTFMSTNCYIFLKKGTSTFFVCLTVQFCLLVIPCKNSYEPLMLLSCCQINSIKEQKADVSNNERTSSTQHKSLHIITVMTINIHL